MSFADIILPVPLEGLFTYAVPQGMLGKVSVGMRVLVPFGRNKTYTGIVAKIHEQQPTDYEVKELQLLLDDAPVVTGLQLRLWQWIANYYMSPIGEVYKAALPMGLKAEKGYRPRTETYIRLAPPYGNSQALQEALSMLGRATKQREAFVGYLQLSGWDLIGTKEGETITALTREELMNETGATLPTINALVKRG